MARHSGQLYVIQFSTDLVNWVNAPVVELGASDEIIWGFTPAGRAFVRLKYSVASDFTIGYAGDADGDGMANGDEVCLFGTDPFTSDAGIDSDGDGIPNSDEFLAGLDPYLADSDGDGTLDINEDSDGDGIINLHELANTSFIHEADTDGDGRPDGDDWMETVDAEEASLNVYLPYDIFDPMAEYPTPTEQVQFQASLTATAPSYDGAFLPSPLQTVPENAPDAGAVILAERLHEINDLDDEWQQSGIYRKGTYRLRTGHAAAGTATGPNANPSAQNETVPVLVHRASYSGFGFSPGNIPVEETFEIQHLSLSNGVISMTAAPPVLPADLEDYTSPSGEVAYHYVTTASYNPIRLGVDTNMNGTVEAFGANGTQSSNRTALADETADYLTADGDGLQKEGDAGLILDINNNNSDAGLGNTPAPGEYDHISDVFDGNPDYLEFGDKDTPPVGHTNGGAVIAITKDFLRALQPSASFPGGQYRLQLASSNSNCLRVHRKISATSFELLVNLELGAPPGTRDVKTIDPAWFSVQGNYSIVPIIIEGVRSGSDTLILELVRTADGGVEHSDRVKVHVNVDQVPDSTLTKRDGIQLGEKATDGSVSTKHYVGANYQTHSMTTGANETIIALRGRIKAEVPAQKIVSPSGVGKPSKVNWWTWLSHKGGKLGGKMRGGLDGPRANSASFWIGLQGVDPLNNNDNGPLGGFSTWAQTGVLLLQQKNQLWSNGNLNHGPVPYLEAGRTVPLAGSEQTTVNPGDSSYAGSGPTGGVFKNWETEGLHFEFVMLERREGSQNRFASWIAVYHDLRPGRQNQYFTLDREMPQIPNGVSDAVRDEINALHNRVRYRRVEAKMEFHNSTSFLFGLEDAGSGVEEKRKAEIGEIVFAVTRTGNESVPNGQGDKRVWDWATGSGPTDAGFVWQPASQTGNLSAVPLIRVNKGLRAVSADEGTTTGNVTTAGFWNIESVNGSNGQKSFRFWDDRSWAFPEARRPD